MRIVMTVSALCLVGCSSKGETTDAATSDRPPIMDRLIVPSDALAEGTLPAPDLQVPPAGQLGSPCQKNADCDSKLCLPIGRCSKKCTGASDCPPAPEWTCAPLPGVGDLCQCTASGSESCDGRDNDCDGIIDNQPAADKACATSSGPGYGCKAGACACIATCGGSCVDTSTNVKHCGKCDNPCPTGASCAGGSCQCPGSQAVCDGKCTDIKQDPANCGGCGKACVPGAGCVAGGCQCPSGQAICGGKCTDTSKDMANCGNCGVTCAVGATCVLGKCECPAGQVPCGSKCTDTKTDPSNCSACGKVCPAASNTLPTCVASVCGSSCKSGYADCDGLASTGCEVLLSSDPANCGTCKHGCPGAACQAGACQPITLASGQDGPRDLAVLAGMVYWVNFGSGNSGTVKKVATSGGTLATLATGQANPVAIEVDSSAVYWANSQSSACQPPASCGGVWKIPLAGGTPTMMDSTRCSEIALDATSVYCLFTGPRMGHRVIKLALTGGVPDTICAMVWIQAIAVDASAFYWSGSMSFSLNVFDIWKQPLSGGTSSILVKGAMGASATDMVADAGQVFWTADTAVLKTVSSPFGTTITALASSPAGYLSQHLAVDAGGVYWTAYSSASGGQHHLLRVGLGGGTPVILASGQGTVGPIAVDSSAVYWIASDKVLKVAK